MAYRVGGPIKLGNEDTDLVAVDVLQVTQIELNLTVLGQEHMDTCLKECPDPACAGWGIFNYTN